MAPLLLYLPPIFGLMPLSMKVVAGLTIVQGLMGSLGGALIHKKFKFVSNSISLYMGISIFITGAIGGAGAHYASNELLLFIFTCLAFTAAILMLFPVKNDREAPDVENLSFNRLRAVNAASLVGVLGGLVGQGGSFILIPLMTVYVKIPTRIAIGSNLAIVILSSLAGFIGKATTGQIEWLLTIPIIVTNLPATTLGGYTSRLIPVKQLRLLLATIIFLASIRMGYTIFV